MLTEIVGAVKKASDIVADIAAACQEQARGIEQVNKAITALDEVTQQNAALVEEAASAAQSLSQEAQQLEQMMAPYEIAA
jgi:methyl-accepting chemotaxis protein